MGERLRLGDMLVAAGMVSEAHVQEALAAQKTSGKRLGEALVALGHVSEQQMTQVLSKQLSLPWVDLYHVDFSRELLELIPASVAEEHSLVPVYVRQVRKQGDTLYVAMDDPLNHRAMQVVADGCGLPVKPMVACPTDILNAIRIYYLGLPALDEEEDEPEDEPQISIEASEDADEELPDERSAAEEIAAADEDDDDDEDDGPGATPSLPPAARRGPGPGFRTLTLLDGTTVRLPSRSERPVEHAAERGLTTRDLIHALSARAAGRDVSDVLPEDAWEPLIAALLSVLLRKGLVADWEFVAEWNKQRRKIEKRKK